MNINKVLTKDYENKPRLRAPGKQTQSNPILSAIALATADSKGAPILLVETLPWRLGICFTNRCPYMVLFTPVNFERAKV